MSEPAADATPVFTIEKIYVKDLSVEVPNAPHCFLERDPAEVSLQMQTSGEAVGDGIFDVTLTLTVTAKVGEKTQFLIELAEAGIFQIRNVPPEELEPIIAVACPTILFPYARETVSDAVIRAGFPPVVLQPINFETVYRQRLAEREAASVASQGPREVPIE